MFQKDFFKKRSVLLTWALSYIVIFTVPLILTFAIYQKASNTLFEESSRANSFMLEQLRGKLEARLSDVDRLVTQIAWDDQLQSLMSNTLTDDANIAYTYYLLNRNLKPLKSSYPWVQNFFVYVHDRDAAISADSVWTSTMVWENLFASSKLTLTDWLSLVKATHTRDAIPMVLSNERKEPYNALVIMQSIPFTDLARPQGTILLIINIEDLFAEISNMTFDTNTDVYILNRSNELIASNQADVIPGEKFGQLVGEPESSVWSNLNGQEVLLTTQTSTKYGWKFVSVTPLSTLMKKVIALRVLFLLSFAFVFIAGLALIFLFTRRNYNPIHQILNVLSNSDQAQPTGSNELTRIKSAILTSLEEKDTMTRLLDDQHRALDNRILAQLLSGEVPEDIQLQETMTRLNLIPTSGAYAVLAFYIENLDSSFALEDSMSEDARIHLVRFTLANVFGELISAKYPCHFFESSGLSVCIVALGSAEPASLQNVQTACHEGMQFLDVNCNMQVCVAMSSIHQGISSILSAWHEASDSLQYRQVFGSDEVLSYTDVMASRESHNRDYPFSPEVENRLLGLLRNGDGEGAMSVVQKLNDEFLKKHRPSSEALRCLYADIAATCLKAAENAASDGISLIDDDSQYLNRIMQARTVEIMFRELDGLIHQSALLCAENRREATSRLRGGAKLAAAIIKVISENYADPNFNIAGLSDHFDMVPYYLSRQFRDETGEALLDYIARYRIGKAKELLIASDISLTGIAERTGFLDSNALIRAFKKIEGMTPGKYREQIKQKPIV